MANDGRVDKHKGRLGDELTKGRQCQRDDAAIDGSAIAVGGGRIYVHAHTHTMHCFIAQAALRTTSSYPPFVHQVIPHVWITQWIIPKVIPQMWITFFSIHISASACCRDVSLMNNC